ncbi:MAG: ribonuclease III [Gammaproteobacteria bacterium]|nr:ribonuclease III [Gammaproteobacteria bacterium]
MSEYRSLEDKLNYQFNDEQLLGLALTHRSFSNVNNERLEFLGDSILNYVISLAIFQRFDSASEGELSRMRSSLVRKETLAEIGRELDIGELIKFGIGERKSGGINRSSILADAVESIFGGILVDGGFLNASSVITRVFNKRLEKLSSDDFMKDPKSLLQEKLQDMGEPPPDYIIISTKGKSPHEVFEVACISRVLKKEARAEGASKRKAEQKAARIALTEMDRDR